MKKTVKTLLPGVIVLTLVVSSAWADEPSIVDAVEDDLRSQSQPEGEALDVDELLAQDLAVEVGKPLNLRKEKPIALNESTPSDGWWWKLLVSGAIVGGALWMLKRRFDKRGPVPKAPVLDVLTRRSVGVRSEICIVSVDGHRLLLGITPGSIQRLAALPDPDEPVTLAEADAEPGFGAMLQGAYRKVALRVDDARVAAGKTVSASVLAESVAPPVSSQPRIIVRDSEPPSAPVELSDHTGAQAESLRMLKRRAS